MMNLNDSLKKRFHIIGWIIIIILIALISRLIYLQLINGKMYRKQANVNAIRSIVINAPRGDIVDKNGAILATSKPSYAVKIVKSDVKKSNLNDVILKLVNLLEKNNTKCRDDLPIYLDSNGKPYFNFKNPDEVNVKSSILIQREKLWKKNNNIKQNATALDAWDQLIKNFKISTRLSPQDIRKVMVIRQLMVEQGYDQYQPVEVAINVNQQTVAQIEENHPFLPGISINVMPIRYYPNGTLLSQTLGYVGRITQSEWQKLKNKGYQMSDLVGHYGLESYLEKYLKGINGKQLVEVDNYGRLIKNLNEVKPVQGDTVYLTINKKLQQAAEDSLQKWMQNIRMNNRNTNGQYLPANIGAAVVVDVKNGDILALANEPGYNPNVFATGNPSLSVIKNLFSSKNPTLIPSPTFNYATMGAIPPGSTFKMATALAALESHVTTVNEYYVDPGIFQPTGQTNWLWNEYHMTQGPINISSAIKYSTDTYFYEMGMRMGINKIIEYAHNLGLDQPTGIELPEMTGTISSPQYKKAYNESILKSMVGKKITASQYKKILYLIDHSNLTDYNTFLKLGKMGIKNVKLQRELWTIMYNAGHWSLPDTTNASIGQGDNQFTPIEMASYISTFVNGGTRYKLHLIDKIVSSDGKVIKTVKPTILGKINIPKNYLNAIKLGMRGATQQGGTASVAFSGFNIPVGGKTGTAQAPNGMQNYGWFVGFAPYNNPQIAIAAVIYQGGSGASTAYVGRDIINAYFKYNKNG